MKLDINTQIEVWKDIKGYEGLYQVSNMGRVKGKQLMAMYGNMLRRKKKGEFSSFERQKLLNG